MKEKRKVARGIIFIGNDVVLLKRIRKEKDTYLHYYAIPGGGIEEGETKKVACLREVKEEVGLDVEISDYLGSEEYEKGICYYYKTKYKGGIPKLGGEEKQQNNPDNYYEVELVNINNLDNIFIYGTGIEMIKKAYNIK